MKGDRSLLARTKLEAFKEWLEANDYPWDSGKGDWECVVFNRKGDHKVAKVYENCRSVHLSVDCFAVGTVKQFLRETKKSRHVKEGVKDDEI